MYFKDHKMKKKTIVGYTGYGIGRFTRKDSFGKEKQKDRSWVTDAKKSSFFTKNRKKVRFCRKQPDERGKITHTSHHY